MKTVAYLLSALTAAAASLVLCPASFAEAPQTLNLTIENHQKLVTVKDDSGKWLFAQVIPTPNLQISQVHLDNNSTRISLLDGAGKTVWSKTAECAISGISPNGEWLDQFEAVWHQAESLGLKDTLNEAGQHVFTPGKIKSINFVIGPNDQLVATQAGTTKHRFVITMINNGFRAEVDKSDVLVVLVQPVPVHVAPAVAQATTP